ADGVALAINQQVVPRACWATTTIHPGDQLLLVGVIAGG
nr:sulfur carrier protein ThiS [Corallincola sp.]